MDFATLNSEQFISLTTFRKTGVGVPTPVWFALDGDDLLVTTPALSGKVKRLRNNPRVEMRPCGRLGKVADDAPIIIGTATIEPDSAHANAVLKEKYGMEYRIMLGFEGVSRKAAGRVILRIAPAVA